MNKNKAAEMLARQRRCWRSQDSDLAIARRAERTYFFLAMMYVCIGTPLTLTQHTLIGRAAILAGFLFGAVLYIWQSWRFGQIRKLLAGKNAKSDATPSA